MTRPEKVAKAQALRAQGLKLREIAEAMDSCISTVHCWLDDPDLSKQRARRRDRYAGRCETCGATTDGSSGFKAPTECATCMRARQHAEREWTPERILAAFRRYYAETGKVPKAGEFNRKKVIGWMPNTSVVQREFGRWKVAIEAAGLKSYSPRQPDRAESAVRRMFCVNAFKAGKTPRQIADALGIDTSSVYWHLTRAGLWDRQPKELAA